MKLEDLLGRRVRYKGAEGRVVEGHADEGQASVTVQLRAMGGLPRRVETVPESEWGSWSSLAEKDAASAVLMLRPSRPTARLWRGHAPHRTDLPHNGERVFASGALPS